VQANRALHEVHLPIRIILIQSKQMIAEWYVIVRVLIWSSY